MSVPEVDKDWRDKPFHFVEVAHQEGQGFWEVDIQNKKALFRESTHKLPDGYMLHNWEEVYQTITDYLKGVLPAPLHVKEIIRDRKYIFNSDPICSYAAEGNVAHNPNQKLHCTKTASVIKAGLPLCNNHASVNF